MKFRDLLFVVCLVAVVALGLRQASLRSRAEESVLLPGSMQTPEIAEYRDKGAPFAKSVEPHHPKGRVDTGFRIKKRITASVLADNESDDERPAIAGFIRSDLSSVPGVGVGQFGAVQVEQSERIIEDRPTTINSEPVSARELQVDGIRWAVYEERWIVSTLGKPEQIGSAAFGDRRYHRWSWPGKRDFIFAESASGSGIYPVKMVGSELAVNGNVVLRAGDPAEKAVAVLGEKLRKVWGTEIAVTAELSEGKVRSVTFEELATVPPISLEE